MAHALHLLGACLDRVKLMNYIALATPFLGIRGSALGMAGLNILPIAATRPITKRLSRTAMELFLEDEHISDTPPSPPATASTSSASSSSSSSSPPPPPPPPHRPQPFLRRVSRPDVLHVLNRFERRVVYSNLHGDLSVGYESAALLHCKPRGFTRSGQWPHVTAESACGRRHHQAVPLPAAKANGGGAAAAGSPPEAADDEEEDEEEVDATLLQPAEESPWLQRDARRSLIRSILRSYWTLDWERYDVCIGFGNALLASPLAHEQIIGKKFGGMMEDKRGKDVVDHLIRGFRIGAAAGAGASDASASAAVAIT